MLCNQQQRTRVSSSLHPQPWIEEKLAAQMRQRPRTLLWVRGHQGEKGNEKADARVIEVGGGPCSRQNKCD